MPPSSCVLTGGSVPVQRRDRGFEDSKLNPSGSSVDGILTAFRGRGVDAGSTPRTLVNAVCPHAVAYTIVERFPKLEVAGSLGAYR